MSAKKVLFFLFSCVFISTGFANEYNRDLLPEFVPPYSIAKYFFDIDKAIKDIVNHQWLAGTDNKKFTFVSCTIKPTAVAYKMSTINADDLKSKTFPGLGHCLWNLFWIQMLNRSPLYEVDLLTKLPYDTDQDQPAVGRIIWKPEFQDWERIPNPNWTEESHQAKCITKLKPHTIDFKLPSYTPEVNSSFISEEDGERKIKFNIDRFRWMRKVRLAMNTLYGHLFKSTISLDFIKEKVEVRRILGPKLSQFFNAAQKSSSLGRVLITFSSGLEVIEFNADDFRSNLVPDLKPTPFPIGMEYRVYTKNTKGKPLLYARGGTTWRPIDFIVPTIAQTLLTGEDRYNYRESPYYSPPQELNSEGMPQNSICPTKYGGCRIAEWIFEKISQLADQRPTLNFDLKVDNRNLKPVHEELDECSSSLF